MIDVSRPRSVVGIAAFVISPRSWFRFQRSGSVSLHQETRKRDGNSWSERVTDHRLQCMRMTVCFAVRQKSAGWFQCFGHPLGGTRRASGLIAHDFLFNRSPRDSPQLQMFPFNTSHTLIVTTRDIKYQQLCCQQTAINSVPLAVQEGFWC